MKYKKICLILLVGLSLGIVGCAKKIELMKSSTDVLNDHAKIVLNIEVGNMDCVPVSLSLYEDNTYELFTSYHACRPYETCNMMLIYTKSIKGTYDYDINKIISESVDADDMSFSTDNLPEYEIRNEFDHLYVVEKGKKNNALNDFLRQINVDLKMCAIKDYDDVITTKPIKEFKLEFDNKKCNSKEKVIYTYLDGRKIYSRCGDIYCVLDNDKIPLSDALDNNLINIEDVTDKMENILGAYDGGTVVFEYDKNKGTIADSSFRLEVCNKIDGSKDMLFLSSKSDNYKCAK